MWRWCFIALPTTEPSLSLSLSEPPVINESNRNWGLALFSRFLFLQFSFRDLRRLHDKHRSRLDALLAKLLLHGLLIGLLLPHLSSFLSTKPEDSIDLAEVMMNVLSSHPQNVQPRMHEVSARGRPCKVALPNSWSSSSVGAQLAIPDPNNGSRPSFPRRAVAVRAVSGGGESSSGKEDDDDDEESKKEEGGSAGSSRREDLERLLGPDDARFTGLDLANLIRNKYGRSYDVTLIKKEFMGRNLLAMNVMWKYREQRSFPLTEEEYLLRLDDVANTLKCWGAVAHVRNTLEKLKERPRIGKAVSIFIDMDETGGRSNEWIYK